MQQGRSGRDPVPYSPGSVVIGKGAFLPGRSAAADVHGRFTWLGHLSPKIGWQALPREIHKIGERWGIVYPGRAEG